MAMDSVEIIVFVFVIIAAIKLLFALFSPKSWMKFAKGLYKTPTFLVIVEVVLAIIVLYLLLQSLTIVQVMAGVVFGALLTGIAFSLHAKESVAAMTKTLKEGFHKKGWLPLLIWIILIIWTLTALF